MLKIREAFQKNTKHSKKKSKSKSGSTPKKNVLKSKINKKKNKQLKGGASLETYADMRLALENTDAIRPGRGCKDPRIRELEDVDLVEFRRSMEPGTEPDAVEHRINLQDLYPNRVIENLVDYQGRYTDQNVLSSCSFSAFINLSILTGNLKNIKGLKAAMGKGWGKFQETWMKIWDKISGGGVPMGDLGELLDQLIVDGYIKDGDWFTYIPIRSFGCSENCYNQEHWIGEEQIKEWFAGKDYDEVNCYSKIPWVFENARLIEDLLDNHIPIEINFGAHSRVCIGYNDENLLFLDSWGPTGTAEAQISHNPPISDVFNGGYSEVDKWSVYSHIRDILIMNAIE